MVGFELAKAQNIAPTPFHIKLNWWGAEACKRRVSYIAKRLEVQPTAVMAAILRAEGQPQQATGYGVPKITTPPIPKPPPTDLPEEITKWLAREQ